MPHEFANVKVPDDPLEVAEIYLSYGLVVAAIKCLTNATPKSGHHLILITDRLSEIKRQYPRWEEMVAASEEADRRGRASHFRRLAATAVIWTSIFLSMALVGYSLWLRTVPDGHVVEDARR